jgi:chromosome segregation ATPase
LLSNHIVLDAKIILDSPHCPLFAIGWQAVTRCEQKAEAVLADVQQKGQALAAQELLLEKREQEASLLQKELSAWSQRLHEEREVVDTERTKMQEKQWQIVGMERDVESKQEAIKQSEKDVDVRMKQLEKERLQMEETQNHILSTNKDKEKNLLTKENNLKAREMEVDERYAAVSELKRSLVEERAKMQEMKEEIVREKSQLRGVDEAISESQITKTNADDAWARAIKAQSDSAEYLRSVEERVKSWEDELTLRESELLQHQHLVEEAEAQAKDDYQHSMVTQSLHFLLQVGSYNLQWPSVMC